jgi:predicted kinase
MCRVTVSSFVPDRLPRLVLISGPCGIGKSTMGIRYAEEHPMALNLGIDVIWQMLGCWQLDPSVSRPHAYVLATGMAEAHLVRGHDVVLPDVWGSVERIAAFEELAERAGARLVEIALLVDRDEAMARARRREVLPGGPLDGISDSFYQEVYDDVMAVLPLRPNTVVIRPEWGDEDGTYRQVLDAIESTGAATVAGR